jgi:hypothetical protein
MHKILPVRLNSPHAYFSGLKGRTLRLLSACTIFALAIESGDGNQYHRPHG